VIQEESAAGGHRCAATLLGAGESGE